jgi:hypothetical protein
MKGVKAGAPSNVCCTDRGLPPTRVAGTGTIASIAVLDQALIPSCGTVPELWAHPAPRSRSVRTLDLSLTPRMPTRESARPIGRVDVLGLNRGRVLRPASDSHEPVCAVMETLDHQDSYS